MIFSGSSPRELPASPILSDSSRLQFANTPPFVLAALNVAANGPRRPENIPRRNAAYIFRFPTAAKAIEAIQPQREQSGLPPN